MSGEETRCSCCASVYENGFDNPPRDRAAVYLWHDPRGYEWPLCVNCTAIWRDNAGGDPEMQPARITQLVPLGSPSPRSGLEG